VKQLLSSNSENWLRCSLQTEGFVFAPFVFLADTAASRLVLADLALLRAIGFSLELGCHDL
jgi:hypothetical protein